MMLRLSFALILVALVTGLVKSYALKKKAPFTSPLLAYRYFAYSSLSLNEFEPPLYQLKKDKRMPKDGWGNPFFVDFKKRLLITAGLDERFHSEDDLYYAWLGETCGPKSKDWFLAQFKNKRLSFKGLPQGLKLQTRNYALSEDTFICYLPDLSGSDGVYGTPDDLFGKTRILVHDQTPDIRKEMEDHRARKKAQEEGKSNS